MKRKTFLKSLVALPFISKLLLKNKPVSDSEEVKFIVDNAKEIKRLNAKAKGGSVLNNVCINTLNAFDEIHGVK